MTLQTLPVQYHLVWSCFSLHIVGSTDLFVHDSLILFSIYETLNQRFVEQYPSKLVDTLVVIVEVPAAMSATVLS